MSKRKSVEIAPSVERRRELFPSFVAIQVVNNTGNWDVFCNSEPHIDVEREAVKNGLDSGEWVAYREIKIPGELTPSQMMKAKLEDEISDVARQIAEILANEIVLAVSTTNLEIAISKYKELTVKLKQHTEGTV